MNILKITAAAGAFAIVSIAALVQLAPATAQQADGKPQTGSGLKTAIFAGGCFWCVESDFDHVPGVVDTLSGYTGGAEADPTYQQVSSKQTGHREAVQVTYDPNVVSYDRLVQTFLRTIDALDNGGQFCDRGLVYSPAIYALDSQQVAAANTEIQRVNAAGVLPGNITLPVIPASTFYAAEGYHQDYYQKNPLRYRFYRASCGRDHRVTQLWGQQARLGLDK